MIIETNRLFLREYKFDDYDALYEIVSDAETMQHYPAPFDEEKTRGWIKWNLENYEKYGFGLWAVVLKETGEFIGDCGITIQNIDGELLPEIGYHIHKKYWRRGFAKEAARAVRDWVFTNTDYNEIYSYMKYTNVASYSTAIAMGMRKVKDYLDPKNYVSYAYSIKRSDWENIVAGQKLQLLIGNKPEPSKQFAHFLLNEGASLNPGPWKLHSIEVAESAEKIAKAVVKNGGNLNSDKAYVYGLLHDIGRRFGVTHLAHVIDGYDYLSAMGFENAARICITHSFNLQTIEDYIGKKDVSENQLEKIQSLLDSYEYDDYDRLIQLLDSTCNADGTKNLEKRMEDVKNRYGYYPQAKYNKNFELKAYFEKLMGKDLYTVLQ